MPIVKSIRAAQIFNRNRVLSKFFHCINETGKYLLLNAIILLQVSRKHSADSVFVVNSAKLYKKH